ncbi:MAG TPA: DUF4214 domain-containing protein, partial [Iamia sp.]|nr:DUF4214 domain-containing protein [Iamia sp.]
TEGMYLALCVDKGPLTAPSPCVGGVDIGGEGGASRWVTNNPYPGTPAVSIGVDGSFTTTLTLEAADANVDCNDLPVGQSCKVVTRMDHRASGDRSQDVKVPITFAEPEAGAHLQLSPANGLFTEGQDVVVSGTGYPTTAPGLYVVYGPEPENNTDATMYGAQAFVPSSAIATDGSFTVTLTDVDAVYTGEDEEDHDFTAGGGFISTMRAHGTPDPNGDWARSRPVTFRARTATESFVTAAHADFLGAEPTRPELAADTAALNQSQTKATYLKDLSTSDIWLAGVVNRLYQDTLGRDGDEGGVAFWVGRLRTGWSVARVAASFYASPEYFDGIGGGTNQTWIDDLYDKVLLRNAFPGDITYWSSEVVAKGRGNVALRIYQSPESAGTRVEGLYADLLGRTPSSGDVTYWGAVVVKKGDLALAVNLANSAEYANRAVARFP